MRYSYTSAKFCSLRWWYTPAVAVLSEVRAYFHFLPPLLLLFKGGYFHIAEGFIKQYYQLFLIIYLMVCCCHKAVQFFEHFANIHIHTHMADISHSYESGFVEHFMHKGKILRWPKSGVCEINVFWDIFIHISEIPRFLESFYCYSNSHTGGVFHYTKICMIYSVGSSVDTPLYQLWYPHGRDKPLTYQSWIWHGRDSH